MVCKIIPPLIGSRCLFRNKIIFSKKSQKDDFHLFIILLKLNPAAASITLISSPIIPL